MIVTVPEPAWCEPDLCDATDPALPAEGGAHRSALVHRVVPVDAGDPVLVTLQLRAPGTVWAAGARPVVAAAVQASTVVAVRVGVAPPVLVPVDQAAGLLADLAALLARAVR